MEPEHVLLGLSKESIFQKIDQNELESISNLKTPNKVLAIAEQLENNVKNHMLMLQGNKQRVKKYFNHKDIKYAD